MSAAHAAGHYGRQLSDGRCGRQHLRCRNSRLLARQPLRQAQPQLRTTSLPATSDDLLGLEAVLGVAELARDGDRTISLAHVLQFLGAEASEQLADPIAGAAAALLETDSGKRTHALVGEEPVEQSLWRQGRIEQLVILDGLGQNARTGPALVVLAQQHLLVLVVGGRAFLHGRNVLDQQPAGAPLPSAAREMAGDGQAQKRRDLLRLPEIGVRGFAQPGAVEGHDALVSVEMATRVDGHREVPRAEQQPWFLARGAPQSLDLVLVEARIGAYAARLLEVDDQQIDRPVGLRLENEPPAEGAVELER